MNLGTHIICDLSDTINEESFHKFNDLDAIVSAFDHAVEVMGATVLNRFSHQFFPQGVTVLYALAESHISCHTHPEKGVVQLDCFTCGSMDSEAGMRVLIEYFSPTETSYLKLPR